MADNFSGSKFPVTNPLFRSEGQTAQQPEPVHRDPSLLAGLDMVPAWPREFDVPENEQ